MQTDIKTERPLGKSSSQLLDIESKTVRFEDQKKSNN
jgi:hypothetical protein